MRLRFTVILGLMLALIVTASQGELKMRTYYNGTFDEAPVWAIDSVIFVDEPYDPPPTFPVTAGTFMMGSPEDEFGRFDNENQHTVTLTTSFEMFSTEVTNRQYMESLQWAYDHGYVTATTMQVRDNVDGSTAELLYLHPLDSEIRFDGAGTFVLMECQSTEAQNAYPQGYDPSNHPVKAVTWYGAVAYCDWLSMRAGLPRAYDHSFEVWTCNGNDPYNAAGYRLPTEAEWEYACRAGTQTPFFSGECLDSITEANYDGSYYFGECPSGANVGWTVPVASYPANTWSFNDLPGNVYEYCNDRYDSYAGDEIDPVGPESGVNIVKRGGGWSYYAAHCRSAFRTYGHMGIQTGNTGFRVVKSAD